ncbi:unnamed protein product [Soboliphyme baturini]|uniref:Tetraspanin n=1 Tax=Soboliphyme baturini TaxID=241478 RepID=A0A183J924_9BILA|nr:unnamed protein product [Soboliphyme baturini]
MRAPKPPSETLHCCGVKTYHDWLNSHFATANLGPPELGLGSGNIGRVPHSCCNSLGISEDGENCGVSYNKLPLVTYEPYLNTHGCLDAVYNRFYHNLDIVIGLAVGIGCFQLMGMVLTILLCCCIDEKQKQMRSEPY